MTGSRFTEIVGLRQPLRTHAGCLAGRSREAPISAISVTVPVMARPRCRVLRKNQSRSLGPSDDPVGRGIRQAVQDLPDTAWAKSPASPTPRTEGLCGAPSHRVGTTKGDFEHGGWSCSGRDGEAPWSRLVQDLRTVRLRNLRALP